MKKDLEKMDLLEDWRMSLLNLNFFMDYIVHKTLVLVKNNLNYLIRCRVFSFGKVQ